MPCNGLAPAQNGPRPAHGPGLQCRYNVQGFDLDNVRNPRVSLQGIGRRADNPCTMKNATQRMGSLGTLALMSFPAAIVVYVLWRLSDILPS